VTPYAWRMTLPKTEKFRAARDWDDGQPSPPQRHERERHQTVAHADLTPFHTACATGAARIHARRALSLPNLEGLIL